MPKITVEAFNRMIHSESPIAAWLGATLETVGEGAATMRLAYDPKLLRPGGVINGVAVMALADFAMYATVMTVVGEERMAVTTSLNVNFLRMAKGTDLIAEGRVLKRGRRLVVCEIEIFAEGEPDPVAHVTGTYALPPAGKAGPI